MHVPMITSKAIGKGFAAIEQNLPLGCVGILFASCDYCSKKIIRQRHNVGHFARLAAGNSLVGIEAASLAL
jgi:hypothetical protein